MKEMKVPPEKPNPPQYQMSNPVKLKDKQGRDRYAVDLRTIPFKPDFIVVIKEPGMNNTVRLLAIKEPPAQKTNGTTDGKSSVPKKD
jgi:hypothetical protein